MQVTKVCEYLQCVFDDYPNKSMKTDEADWWKVLMNLQWVQLPVNYMFWENHNLND